MLRGGSTCCAAQGPIGRLVFQRAQGWHLDRLHHLAQCAVGQQHHQMAVAEGQIEADAHQVHRFLHGGRGQHQRVVVAVAGRAGHLEIVGLAGVDVTQSRPAAHHIHHHTGHFAGRNVAQPLLHQTDPRRRGGGEGALARAGRAVNHMNRADFALGLQKDPAQGRQALGEIFEQFGLGGDRVAEIGVGPGPHSRLGNGFVALPQLGGHTRTLPSR